MMDAEQPQCGQAQPSGERARDRETYHEERVVDARFWLHWKNKAEEELRPRLVPKLCETLGAGFILDCIDSIERLFYLCVN